MIFLESSRAPASCGSARAAWVLMAMVGLSGLVGCEKADDVGAGVGDGSAAPTASTNRIELQEDTVANLGITFAEARRGRLRHVLSVPGHLVAPQTHRFEIRAPAVGVVRSVVPRFTAVKSGDVVAEIITDELGRIQARLQEAIAALAVAEIEVQLVRANVAPLGELSEVRQAAADDAKRHVERARSIRDRTRVFAESAVRRLDAMVELAESTVVTAADRIAAERDAVEAEAAALDADHRITAAELLLAERRQDAARARVRAATALDVVAAREAVRAGARARVERGVDVLSALSGFSRDTLTAGAEGGSDPFYLTLTRLPLAAPGDGVVARVLVADGGWMETNQPILEIVDTRTLFFEGAVPESDLAKLQPAAIVRVVPVGGAFPALEGTLVGPPPVVDRVTLMAPVRVKVENGAAGLAAGISATAELVVSQAEYEEVLVPEACVVADGLMQIVFRRDPADPMVVIRTPVATGYASGGWVEVISGVGEGDGLVLAGVRQLKQIRLGNTAGPGHFHADGTFHEGDS